MPARISFRESRASFQADLPSKAEPRFWGACSRAARPAKSVRWGSRDKKPFQPPPGADLELEGLVSQEELELLKRLYLEGMTYEEMAAEENLNQNTLAARVRRIKLRFQKIYREIENFSDPPCKKSDTARHKEKRGGSKL